jgi:hypothetical protein
MNDDYNSMQANMGLVGSGGSFSPVGIPTPMPRHPGEMSAFAVQQAQAASYATVSMTNPAGPMSMGASPLGSFARQYQSNMAQIQGQQFNPIMANYMSGGSGFTQGMLPSPAMMTPSNMGIFRPFAQAPSPVIPSTPHMPLITTPFTAHPADPMFATPFEYSAAHGYHRGLQYNAAFQATPSVASRFGADAMYGMLGAGAGARLGARLGGVRGAAVGSIVGGIAGFAGSELSGLGETAGAIADRMNLFRQMAIRGAQMRSMSQDWVVGGGAMDLTGRGLNTSAAMNLGRRIEDLSYDSGFKKETANRFSTQDLTRITQMAGQEGLLSATQTPEAITAEVKKIAKAVHMFGQIAGDPDVANAIRSLSQMRSLGMTYGESLQSLQSAKLYARMGGTNVAGIMEQGQAGALTFQQLGLSGALGFNVGMGAYGMAGQAVAGGTFTPAQAAMLGGKSGIAQRDMESTAAMLRMPMMAAAMGNFMPGGTFGLNSHNASALMGGKLDVNQMATMGADNLLAAVQKGGVGALGMFMAQQGELQDQLGRAMGPTGLQGMKMRQVANTMRMLGLSGPQGFVTAAQAMGMDGQTALQLMRTANSPEYFSNVQRQMQVQRQDLRFQGEAERKALAPGFMSGLAQDSSALHYIGDVGNSIGSMGRNFIEGVNSYFVESGEMEEAYKRGRKIIRNPASLRASSNMEARLIAGLSQGDINTFKQGLTRSEDSVFRFGGRGYGKSELVGDIRNWMGGDPEAMAELLRAEGGFSGLLGRSATGTGAYQLSNMLGITNLSGDDVRSRGTSIGAASRMLLNSKGSSVSERTEALGRLGKKLGDDKASAVVSAFSSRLADIAKSKDSIFGGGALNREDLQKARAEAAKQVGVNANDIDLQDLVTGGSDVAETLAGAKGFDAFSMPSMEIGSEIMGARSKDGLLAAQEKIATNVFGENGWLETDEDRAQALSGLLGQNADPRVAIVAGLMQARADGDKNADSRLQSFLNGLPMKDRAAVTDAAKSMLSNASTAQKRYLRRAGVTATGTKSNTDLLRNFQTAQKQSLAVKAVAKERGWDVESKEVGGHLTSAEAGLNKQAENFKQLEGEMASNFPASVQTFDQASKALLEAAIRLGTMRPTSLDSGVN